MSKITLTTPEDRTAEVVTADVVEVRIAGQLMWDDATPSISFRYQKGHTAPSWSVDYLSNLVTIKGADYVTYVRVVPPAPTETMRSNLDRRLLQYLLDRGIVQPGVIS